MYDVRWLSRVAFDGLADLMPAVRRAFDNERDNDRLDLVFGRSPRAAIIALSVGCVLGGALFARLIADTGLNDFVHWPAVAVGLAFAGMFRGYLFRSGRARAEDFPWLAASLVPAIGLLGFTVIVSRVASDLGEDAVGLATVTRAVTDALGVAAAVVIAVAALCFSRAWLRALGDLALRLLVFRVMVFVTTLVLLEIGIVGPIISGVLSGILDIDIPDWIPEALDQLTHLAVMGIIYLAVIGASWTACRDNFGRLLEEGHVDVLAAIVDMAQSPKKRERKARRAEKKREKAQAKARKKGQAKTP